ncbi:ankyrin repeat domain-containing protein [Roseisalinus antarcticus]|uniref:Ankyrin repeats (3 copies) n=1 Tax=Roseisalinus antarcticus TaxID=254357 RepID=A0A1Y5RPL0_9RHOB|nr:ankyrin repeat domain-containing protein [Roseisalinus antarcticus]SLN22437.1 Ankyrin repeats (3 copies) [Roseisalinus antarcticus]
MTPDDQALDRLRRAARDLGRDLALGRSDALARVRATAPKPKGTPLKHADFLHVIAREEGFASWPALKASVEMRGMDAAARLQRLKIAIAHGQTHVIDRILEDAPDLADGEFGLELALYRRDAVARALEADPGMATRLIGLAPPLVHLCQSRMIHHWPDKRNDMLAIAEMLRLRGADLDFGPPAEKGSAHRLSPLYFALGHAGNLVLAEWLLDHGATPNDNESLYHATELGHRDGLRLLLSHGADPKGTNALLRAMDFGDVEAVAMLLEAGADPNEGSDGRPAHGMAHGACPALHQAARRMGDDRMAELLLAAGARPEATWNGISAYAYARVYGNAALAARLEGLGVDRSLAADEALLAAAAEGAVPGGRFLDPARLPEDFRTLPRQILNQPGRLPHLKALIAVGLEWDRPDSEGLTLVRVAGWEGLPEIMAWVLSLKPDLGHVNQYGGTLLTTIIHGSENCPQRAERDHVACARLALEEGVALPRKAISFAGEPAMAAFLDGWAEAHPGAVVEHGPI